MAIFAAVAIFVIGSATRQVAWERAEF